MMDKVTRKTGNLTQYVEIAELMGPKALAADRDDAESQFTMMVDGPDRGLLITTVRGYYYGNRAVATSAAFASGKLFDFLLDTRSGTSRGTYVATTRLSTRLICRAAPIR